MPKDDFDAERKAYNDAYHSARWFQGEKMSRTLGEEAADAAHDKAHPHEGETKVNGVWTNDPSLFKSSKRHNTNPHETRDPAEDLVCLGDQLRPFQGYDQDPPNNESDLFSTEAMDTIVRLKPTPRRQWD